MTTFSLPVTLVAGTNENVNDVQTNFTAIRDHINGNLDTTNFATSAKPSTLLGPWQTIATANANAPTGMVAGTYVFTPIAISASGQQMNAIVFNLDSTRFSVAGLTAKLAVTFNAMSNATASGVTFTAGLHNITAAGGTGTNPTVTVNTTAVAGSTIALAPGAGIALQGSSSAFAIPSGNYALCVATNATMPSNSAVTLNVRLEVHWE